MQHLLQGWTKADFEIDSGQMAISANEEATERATPNHSVASKYQFETVSK